MTRTTGLGLGGVVLAVPHFSPSEQAFYYVRVLQVPTWRWSHFDCQGSTLAACQPGGGLDVTIQERAWSSPIWYSP